VAALGSFLEARSRGGHWLLRMEDLDTPRVRRGCAAQILATLEGLGLTWDGPVEYQSTRTAHYAAALERLRAAGLTFECSCTRRERAGGGYPGTCRGGPTRPGPTATRFRMEDGTSAFTDLVQGECRFDLGRLGDVIVRRRDGLIAYQLAVVVDDALQGITDVVRGADLLDNTPWQLALQQALGLPRPRYAHLPLITEPGGAKLAKSRRSLPVRPGRGGAELHGALILLGQAPPATLKSEPAAEVLRWAQAHWRLDRVQKVAAIPAPDEKELG
jgi:glutamyl-Q tRNA(Asp) synthetase